MSKAFTIVNIHDNYSKEFLSNHPNHLEKALFKSILSDFFKLLVDEIINEGYVYKIPHHMGEIYIKRFKPTKGSSNKPIDWELTNEIYGAHNKKAKKGEKKFIYHRNNHSGGYSGRWYWRRKDSKILNKSIYRMRAVRDNSRAVSQAIKHKNTINKYLE